MTQSAMWAGVYRGIGDLRPEVVPTPEPGPGEVLVRIDSCGVCGTDIKKIQQGLVPPPRIFGHEMAGTIAVTGHGTKGWAVGDRVAVMHHVPCGACHYCERGDFAQCAGYKKTGTTAGFEPAGGGFAEYIRVMDWIVDHGMVRVPDNVALEEATFIEPVNTCLKAVLKAGIQPGDTVLVVGQGQIGLIFTQLARIHGATVCATDRIPYRLERSVAFGADWALDPEKHDVPAELRARTCGRGADLAVVTVANAAVAVQAFEAVRPGGKVLLFANTHLGDPVTIDAGAVCMLEKDLIGSYSSDLQLQERAADLIFGRALNVRDLVSHRYPIEKIGEAIRTAVEPRGHSLKVMVKP